MSVYIGYHCLNQQYSPSQLLTNVVLTEHSGFDHAMCSAHIHPSSERQGQSGRAWSRLGAALNVKNQTFDIVNAPDRRYHPTIVAQAAVTRSEMSPKRLWFALGSGQAPNEHVTGANWPEKPDRNSRLRECVDGSGPSWAGETVTHKGLSDIRSWNCGAEAPVAECAGACHWSLLIDTNIAELPETPTVRYRCEVRTLAVVFALEAEPVNPDLQQSL